MAAGRSSSSRRRSWTDGRGRLAGERVPRRRGALPGGGDAAHRHRERDGRAAARPTDRARTCRPSSRCTNWRSAGAGPEPDPGCGGDRRERLCTSVASTVAGGPTGPAEHPPTLWPAVTSYGSTRPVVAMAGVEPVGSVGASGRVTRLCRGPLASTASPRACAPAPGSIVLVSTQQLLTNEARDGVLPIGLHGAVPITADPSGSYSRSVLRRRCSPSPGPSSWRWSMALLRSSRRRADRPLAR